MDYVAPKTNYNVNQIGHYKQLVVGAGTKVFKANNDGVFAGSSSYGSAPFKLSYAGVLTAVGLIATNADITGKITSTSGAIGGWTIGATSLTGGGVTLSSAGALSVGSGDNIFKANSSGIYLGNSTFGSAPFRVSMAGALTATDATITGAITATSGSFTGAITATSGDISGDLTVTGSLLSADSSAYQTKIVDGKISFLKSTAEKAYIKTATDNSSLAIASGDRIYFTKTSGSPLLNIDQDSNITIASDAFIIWSSGRKLTASGSKIACDGDFDVTGVYKIDDESGDTGTFKDYDGNTITVKGGIITGGV